MSTHIEFEQVAVRLTPKQVQSEWGDSYLILLVDGGDNNSIGLDGRIARRWYVMGYGVHDSAMRQVVNRAADCESGLLRMDSRARGVRPEAYIRRWRQRFDEAWTLDYAAAARFTFAFRIDMDAERIAMAMTSAIGVERLRRLRDACPPITVSNPAFASTGTVQRHEFSVADPAQMAMFNDMHDLGHGPWSRKVHTSHHSQHVRASIQGLPRPEAVGIGHIDCVRHDNRLQA